MTSPDTHSTTLCITLNKEEFLDSRVVRLHKGWNLRFVCGAGLLGRHVRLHVYGIEKTFEFKELRKLEELDDFVQLTCDFFGAFKYEAWLLPDDKTPVARGYFSIVPEWEIANKETTALDGLSIITHLAKLLGPFNEWEDRLRVAKEAGYNVIHLTPIQTLGVSNSSYSIADHHKLNPVFGEEYTLDDVQKFVEKLEHEWSTLAIQDVVWNHAAKNAQWLWDHPECAYNCVNSPHLRPAYVVDRALQQFSREIGDGKWESKGIPAVIDSDAHLAALREVLLGDVFPKICLQEFFQVDIDKCVEEFRRAAKGQLPSTEGLDADVKLVQDPQYRRHGTSVDLELALKRFNHRQNDAPSEDERIERCANAFRQHLETLNQEAGNVAFDHVFAAVNAIMGHVHYERVAGHGPRRGLVTDEAPLVTNYFLHRGPIRTWEDDEKALEDPDEAKYAMACNGWIMNADPLVNFAEPPSMVYLRRELVCWGDCVKLNYGRAPEDCPYLWDYMQKYSEQCARIFHGFRIDNCHSTPIHVAEYLLQAARKIRPNLYVVAELFTGAEDLDNLFVNRLGITSLVREAQNAPDSHEQGRFVYRYGGDPVGAFRFKSVRPATGAVAHALFYDQTHDNPTPFKKRTAYDYVPTAAMTAMAYCSSGSTRGYDEFVPFHIDVVKETRLYQSWSEVQSTPELLGMIKARKLFNDLHYRLSKDGFSEIFVDQVNADVVAITRHNPVTRESVLLIAHTCFSTSAFRWKPECRNVDVADDITDILFEVKTVEDPAAPTDSGKAAADRITGLHNFTVEIHENVEFGKSMAVDVVNGSISFKLFPSGSVVAFKIAPKPETKDTCAKIESLVASDKVQNELKNEVAKLSLDTLGYVLFRCEGEEQAQFGTGAYDIPGFGKTVYCGLQGIYPLIKRIQNFHDLGHPLCGNLRAGNWISEYTVNRLRRLPELEKVAQIFDDTLSLLAHLPHFLRPCYFERLFSYLYDAQAPNGHEILKAPVLRLYPADETEYGNGEKEEPLHDTMHEALQRHFAGISFRERNAGSRIDEHMRDEGFNVSARIDHETGLVFGGNQWNAGTWMDKMGSSDKAGNRGLPATPRDGAAVELQGLALFVAENLDALSADADSDSWTWRDWAHKIRESFPQKFYVDDDNSEKHVNRRGILKDTFGSTFGFTDFQLRPNFGITLATVPDIVELEKAWRALKTAGDVLEGPLGICTLDPT
ncbi:glycogen debranching enzyme [Aphelenchoides avenae]|nr:glycogen debranching enzyme [Aphelenchus avenae]